ncbi:MAG: hypothetical protein A2849_02860 [Candidatus Taylorbacteria bacterium RIFCSPHIGHO2_01_FULL_51_15]|uniref:Uncharacterized protein n=1 Tax=Candidatus Taylorbacteria bacterium RIFCSPHIGHO2_01_FULL_51_15 TaxID=1802304 RepID=A0A1G2MAV8_9BACT|nr:MAG: hypothetical protein A2849_02860 [Candidatus Taylorbacteria bacterium RIFCSPHIGHO2_01_FULL_51_15]
MARQDTRRAGEAPALNFLRLGLGLRKSDEFSVDKRNGGEAGHKPWLQAFPVLYRRRKMAAVIAPKSHTKHELSNASRKFSTRTTQRILESLLFVSHPLSSDSVVEDFFTILTRWFLAQASSPYISIRN